jgi:hypothetical protein
MYRKPGAGHKVAESGSGLDLYCILLRCWVRIRILQIDPVNFQLGFEKKYSLKRSLKAFFFTFFFFLLKEQES